MVASEHLQVLEDSKTDTYSPPPSGNGSLKKSLSVDSFVHFGRDPPTAVGSSLNSASPNSHINVSASNLNASASKREQESRCEGRGRGSSFSTFRDHVHLSVDPDLERSDPLSSSVHSHHRTSSKAQDQSKPPVRGGELSLPSRTPVLSATSSMSSIMSVPITPTSSGDIPRQQSLSSLQSFPGRLSSLPTESTGRVRSGSLGLIGSSSRRILINTNVPPTASIVTLLVVGSAGCGKSTVIRKGLRGHGISEPTLMSVASIGGASKQYSRRIGVIRNDSSPDTPLHVIELDIPKEPTDQKRLDLHQSLSINGVIICYDSSDEASFEPVEGLLQAHRDMKLPLIVLACKSDLPRQIEPERALNVLQPYDVGLVEVAKTYEQGKDKMRRTFGWILRAVARERRNNRNDPNYRNPASPDVLISSPPWEKSRIILPMTPPSLLPGRDEDAMSEPPTATSPDSPLVPIPPVRTRSTGDILSENEKSKIPVWHPDAPLESANGRDVQDLPVRRVEVNGQTEISEYKEEKEKEKETRPGQWPTLDELLDKLLFLAVSGDDPAFVTHFLLTYRRFATPRSVLLAMQKRMRQLDNLSSDPMFACFAQMKICHLLELWIRDYPHDFAVRGTAGALSALIKSIISKTYLLHYGTEFLPFLEMLPSLTDHDAAWAFKVEDPVDESDDSYSLLEEDGNGPDVPSPVAAPEKSPLPAPARERKPSVPLPLILANTLNTGSLEPDASEKQQIKDLVKLAHEVLAVDPDEIAQEITRVEVKLFLDIKPRHWLHYTFVSGKKDITDPITAYNAVSNHLADWVVSLILCHKTPRARVKQIEKFVEIAQRLRALNNYSALRAFVAGINIATFGGDETMEQFKLKSPEQAKNLQSWDVLLQHVRSHRAYRLALRNSKGPCIPALEVHMSDLIRAHEGNGDFHSSDPTKIHWGKFNMMGRFISSTAQCQARCRSANDYNFPERKAIGELLVKRPVMNDQMREARIALVEAENDEYRPSAQSTTMQPRDTAILRRLWFW